MTVFVQVVIIYTHESVSGVHTEVDLVALMKEVDQISIFVVEVILTNATSVDSEKLQVMHMVRKATLLFLMDFPSKSTSAKNKPPTDN